MSGSRRAACLLLSMIGYVVMAAGLQSAPHGAAKQLGSGAISVYDTNGNVIFTFDAQGNRSNASTSQTATAAPKVKTAQAVTAAVGNTIHVPADQPTIQAAINAAVNGDTVLVSDGTYKENINFLGKNITVTSVNGNKATTIDGGKLDTVVIFKTQETSAAVLNGFTITNGLAGSNGATFGEGGGIAVLNASPNITNNVITANGACNGAGIGVGFAGPLIQGNTITNNFQFGCSGGIGGGGISIRGESSNTRVVNNVISNNVMVNSGINGGGIELFAGGSPLIQGNVISNNNQFGLSMVNSSTPQMVQNLIIHNTGGGLVYLFGGGTGMTIINNTFADNDAQPASISQSTASVIGGILPPDVVVQNNLLIAKAGQTAIFCAFPIASTAVFTANNVFSDGGLAFDPGCGTVPTGTSGNISSDPFFVDPSVDNFHLQPVSPSIDTGNNTLPSAFPALDLDGNARIVNTTIDMGVFEFQGTTTATFSATSLTFAKQLTGTTSTPQTVTIANTGSTALQIIPFVLSSNFVETDDCHTSTGLGAGKSCSINISFAPAARGTLTGTLVVTSNDAAGPTTINLSGIGGTGIASFSVPSLSFANQLVGSTSAPQQFTLTNTGDEPMAITNIAANGDFAQTNNCGTSLASNGTCTFNVTFNPTLRGARTGSISITDDALGSPHSVTLQGTGIGPAVTLSATSLTFAGQLAGTTSASLPITLTNSGETALNITSVTPSGDFSQTNDCGTSVASGNSCTIQVSFAPTARGPRTGAITIVDDSTSSPEHISLSGSGTAPVASLSRTSLAFGNQILNVPINSSVTLTNTGDAALAITSIAANGDFSQTNNCGTTLPAQAQCTITITFTALALGPRIGSLTFTDSGLDSPQNISLSGTGVQLGFSSSNLTFANQVAGTTSATQPVTITNLGSSALNITGVVPSAGFSQTNNCGTSLAGNGSCTLNIAFVPNAAGPVTGLITISYSGTQSTITVSGTATDFNIGTQQGSSSSATINAGGTAAYNLALSGSAGFTGSVSLTCSGVPAAASCTVNPASANLNGTTPVNFSVNISTTARSALSPLTWTTFPPISRTPLFLMSWMALTALLFGLLKNHKSRYKGALAALALGMAMFIAGCGGGGSTPPPPVVHAGTPAGTSTVIVTATSGSATRTFNLTLNVN